MDVVKLGVNGDIKVDQCGGGKMCPLDGRFSEGASRYA